MWSSKLCNANGASMNVISFVFLRRLPLKLLVHKGQSSLLALWEAFEVCFFLWKPFLALLHSAHADVLDVEFTAAIKQIGLSSRLQLTENC